MMGYYETPGGRVLNDNMGGEIEIWLLELGVVVLYGLLVVIWVGHVKGCGLTREILLIVT